MANRNQHETEEEIETNNNNEIEDNNNETEDNNNETEEEIEIISEEEGETCVICFDTVEGDLITLDCNHVFHKECIDRLILSTNTTNYECPLCKRDFSLHRKFKYTILKKEAIEKLNMNPYYCELFMFFCNELKDDKEIVKIAVTHSGKAFKYASNRIRNNRHFIKELLAINSIFPYIPVNISTDKIFLLSLLERFDNCYILYKLFDYNTKQDEEITLKYIKRNEECFQYCNGGQKRSEEFMIKSIISNDKVTKYIDNFNEKRKNKEFMNKLIQSDVCLYDKLHYDLRNDIGYACELVDMIINNKPNDIIELYKQFRINEIKYNFNIINNIFNVNKRIIDYLPFSISLSANGKHMAETYLTIFSNKNNNFYAKFNITLNDFYTHISVFSQNMDIYEYVFSFDEHKEFQKEIDMCYILNKFDTQKLFNNKSEEYIKDIYIRLIKYEPTFIENIPSKYLDKEYFIQIFTHNHKLSNIEYFFNYVPATLKNDKTYMLSLVKLNNKLFEFLPEQFKIDSDFKLHCDISHVIYKMEYKNLPNEIKINEEFTIKIINILNDYNFKFNSERYKYMMEYINEILTLKPQLIDCVIKTNYELFRCVDDKYKEDKELILRLAKIDELCAFIYRWASIDLKEDITFTSEILKCNGFVYDYIPTNLKQNFNVILIAIEDINKTFSENIDDLKSNAKDIKKILKNIPEKNESHPEVIKCCNYYNQICSTKQQIIPGKRNIVRII